LCSSDFRVFSGARGPHRGPTVAPLASRRSVAVATIAGSVPVGDPHVGGGDLHHGVVPPDRRATTTLQVNM
jgi:hypothetical protein